jgi:H+/Cl- antiporter ClcA
VTESEGSPRETPVQAELEPLPVSTPRIIIAGIVAWVAALLATVLVPALHEADRSWWPWTCVTGIALGLFGYAYVRRGRGNAHDAS